MHAVPAMSVLIAHQLLLQEQDAMTLLEKSKLLRQLSSQKKVKQVKNQLDILKKLLLALLTIKMAQAQPQVVDAFAYAWTMPLDNEKTNTFERQELKQH